jgi:hypothetical protein
MIKRIFGGVLVHALCQCRSFSRSAECCRRACKLIPSKNQLGVSAEGISPQPQRHRLYGPTARVTRLFPREQESGRRVPPMLDRDWREPARIVPVDSTSRHDNKDSTLWPDPVGGRRSSRAAALTPRRFQTDIQTRQTWKARRRLQTTRIVTRSRKLSLPVWTFSRSVGVSHWLASSWANASSSGI